MTANQMKIVTIRLTHMNVDVKLDLKEMVRSVKEPVMKNVFMVTVGK